MNANRLMVALMLVAGASLACSTRAVVHKESSPRPVVVHDQHGGPPPHAPAHGYRHKHGGDDVVLVYDRHLDVYIVSGYKDCYYTAGQYFRFVDGSWEWSVSVSTGWKMVADYSEVPSSLCTKHGKGKSHKKNKNKNKGKH